MAKIKCDACDSLKATDPNLAVNGWSDTECASFKNDTGLNPTSGHNDCTDLELMTDCLIGNMAQETDAYNNCDWKEFAKKFIANLWTVLTAIKCALCGIWTNIHNLWSRVNEIINMIKALCQLVNASINPTAPIYGIFPRTPLPEQQARTCGTIPTINGRPALIDAGNSTEGGSHWGERYTGVGIYWGTVEGLNCDTQVPYDRHFWKPYIWGMKLNKDAEIGDAIWVISKSELQHHTTWSDELWQSYTDESWTWNEDRIVSGSDAHKTVWIRLHVGDAGYSNDYLVMTFRGTSYPNEAPDYDAEIHTGGTGDMRWG